MNTNEKQDRPFRIIVELDALLDTRYAVMKKQYPSVAKDTRLMLDYLHRVHDYIKLPDGSFLKDHYDKRDETALHDSIITRLIKDIRDFLYEHFENATAGAVTKRAELVVNVYPYDLTQAEKKDICKAVWLWLDKMIDVKHTHLSLDQITPTYLKNNVDILFYYDFLDWFDIHSKTGELGKKPCPSVRVYLPMRIRTPKTIMELLGEQGANNPFDDLKEITSLSINLNFMPVDSFNLNIDLIKKISDTTNETKANEAS